MPPEGSLTPAQLEILEHVWAAGPNGLTVAAIWQAVATKRSVQRTTVLNLVDRLEKRGWLRRRGPSGDYHYIAAIGLQEAKERLAGEFVDAFFGGSPESLVMTLMGTGELKSADLDRVRKMLDEAAAKRRRGKS
jgi:predicted transcriptional regulator